MTCTAQDYEGRLQFFLYFGWTDPLVVFTVQLWWQWSMSSEAMLMWEEKSSYITQINTVSTLLLETSIQLHLGKKRLAIGVFTHLSLSVWARMNHFLVTMAFDWLHNSPLVLLLIFTSQKNCAKARCNKTAIIMCFSHKQEIKPLPTGRVSTLQLLQAPSLRFHWCIFFQEILQCSVAHSMTRAMEMCTALCTALCDSIWLGPTAALWYSHLYVK